MDLSPRDTGDISGGRDSGVKSAFKNNNVNTGTCVKCRGLPDAGGKLRSCSACQAVKYCSRTCQVADWRSYHKRFCARFAAERKDALAVIGGAGHGPDSAKKLLDASLTTATQWYDAHRSVFLRVQFLAWKHRQEQPVLVITTASLRDDSEVQVEMVPRRQWEVDDDEGYLASILYFFEKSDFDSDTYYISVINVAQDCSCTMGQRSYSASAVHRLRSCMSLALTCEEYVAEMHRRNNDPDAVYVRLTGLYDAAHLNGQEGVLMTGEDPHHPGRRTIRLENRKDIHVRPENFEMVSRPELPPEYDDIR